MQRMRSMRRPQSEEELRLRRWPVRWEKQAHPCPARWLIYGSSMALDALNHAQAQPGAV